MSATRETQVGALWVFKINWGKTGFLEAKGGREGKKDMNKSLKGSSACLKFSALVLSSGEENQFIWEIAIYLPGIYLCLKFHKYWKFHVNSHLILWQMKSMNPHEGTKHIESTNRNCQYYWVTEAELSWCHEQGPTLTPALQRQLWCFHWVH